MQTRSRACCAVLLLLCACSGNAPTTSTSTADAGPPGSEPFHPSSTTDAGKSAEPARDAGAGLDANAPDAESDADSAPACDLPSAGKLTKLLSAYGQLEASTLQAYDGVLYWSTQDGEGYSAGQSGVSAYVLAQNRFFSIQTFTPHSLNVNAYGINVADVNSLHRYDFAGGNPRAYDTVTGVYPVLRTDGGYELAEGTAVDHSDNALYVTDSNGQWQLDHALKGAFTPYVAADDTSAYFVLFSEPLDGPRDTQVVKTTRNLDFSSGVVLGDASDQKPTGFAIDDTSVFVATEGTGATLAVSPKAGGSWTTLVDEAGITSLAVTSQYVYYASYGGRGLYRVKKDGSKPAELVLTPCGAIETVTAAGDAVYFIEAMDDGVNGIRLWSVE